MPPRTVPTNRKPFPRSFPSQEASIDIRCIPWTSTLEPCWQTTLFNQRSTRTMSEQRKCMFTTIGWYPVVHGCCGVMCRFDVFHYHCVLLTFCILQQASSMITPTSNLNVGCCRHRSQSTSSCEFREPQWPVFQKRNDWWSSETECNSWILQWISFWAALSSPSRPPNDSESAYYCRQLNELPAQPNKRVSWSAFCAWCIWHSANTTTIKTTLVSAMYPLFIHRTAYLFLACKALPITTKHDKQKRLQSAHNFDNGSFHFSVRLP